MFPTAAAIRLYMKRAMDDRAALTITFTYMTTIILVIASDAFIVGSALAHAFGEPAWVASLWIVGLLGRRRRHQPARHHRGRTAPGRRHDRGRAGHARHRPAGPRAQRARPARPAPAPARAPARRPPRGGRARRVPLQRVRVGDDERRGGAQAGVDQPRHVDRHRHPVRRVLGRRRGHEPHPDPQRAHVRLPPALPRDRRHRALRAVGDGRGHRGHRAQHVQRRLHHRIALHLRHRPRGLPAAPAGPSQRPRRALGARGRPRRGLRRRRARWSPSPTPGRSSSPSGRRSRR